MSQGHHFIERQTVKLERSKVRIWRSQGRELTTAQERLIDTPLDTILGDRRNEVRLPKVSHDSLHSGASQRYQIKRSDLHPQIDEFASAFALEHQLEKKLRSIDQPRKDRP